MAAEACVEVVKRTSKRQYKEEMSAAALEASEYDWSALKTRLSALADCCMLRTDTIPPRVPLREGTSLLGGVEALVFDDGLAIPVSGYQRVRRDAHVSKKAKMAPIRRLEPENWPLPCLPALRHFAPEKRLREGSTGIEPCISWRCRPGLPIGPLDTPAHP